MSLETNSLVLDIIYIHNGTSNWMTDCVCLVVVPIYIFTDDEWYARYDACIVV